MSAGDKPRHVSLKWTHTLTAAACNSSKSSRSFPDFILSFAINGLWLNSQACESCWGRRENEWVCCSITEGKRQGDWVSFGRIPNRWQPFPHMWIVCFLIFPCRWVLLMGAGLKSLSGGFIPGPFAPLHPQRTMSSAVRTPSTPAPSLQCTKSQVQHELRAGPRGGLIDFFFFLPPSPLVVSSPWKLGAAVKWDLLNEPIGAGLPLLLCYNRWFSKKGGGGGGGAKIDGKRGGGVSINEGERGWGEKTEL